MYEELYKSVPGRLIARVIACPVFSRAAGAFLGCPLSKPFIKKFADKKGIDLSQAEKTEFSSFNDFFTRRLKPGLRPLGEGLVSPCDGLLSSYKLDGNCHFSVKGSTYTPGLLTQDEQLNARFAGGWCLVFRLTPAHYHRYIFPADGVITDARRINGIFHTVRPIALEYVPVFKTNTREFTVCETERYGLILQMEVGAAMVGRITNNVHAGEKVTRGAEKGYFEFGGSTIILFVQKDACALREDILDTGENELNVKAGETIGS